MRPRGGVYVIRHRAGAFYVGATSNFAHRRKQHWNYIRSGKGECRGLATFARSVEGDTSGFSFHPLLVCDVASLRLFEDRALAIYHGTAGCLNNMRSGNVHDLVTRQKMSAIGKGRPSPKRGTKASAETRRKQSAAHKGKKLTAEHRAKMSAASIGRKKSAAHCLALSKARKGTMAGELNPFWGKTHSPEAKAKIVAANERYRASHGHPFLGKKHTPESRARMSAGRTRARLARGGP